MCSKQVPGCFPWPYALVTMPLYNLWSLAGLCGSLLVSWIQLKWRCVPSEIGFWETAAFSLGYLALTLRFLALRKVSLHVVSHAIGRLMWCRTEGGPWSTAREKLGPSVQHFSRDGSLPTATRVSLEVSNLEMAAALANSFTTSLWKTPSQNCPAQQQPDSWLSKILR